MLITLNICILCGSQNKQQILLSRSFTKVSTSDITTLLVISSNIIAQEVGYFGKSTLSSSLRELFQIAI
jgi:hypothetical protein